MRVEKTELGKETVIYDIPDPIILESYESLEKFSEVSSAMCTQEEWEHYCKFMENMNEQVHSS